MNIENILFLDLETYSETPIAHGTYKYKETSEILLFSYALGNELVTVWDRANDPQPPKSLQKHLKRKDITLCAHNSNFDRNALGRPHREYPWIDTMIQAYRHSLPGSLKLLCPIFKIDQDKAKLKEGDKLIQLFCKPLPKNRKLRRAAKQTHPEEWQRFIEYARKDVEAMRELYKIMPIWNNSDEENTLWNIDQKINDRGFCIDLNLAKSALRAFENEKEINNRKTVEKTNNKVQAATQRDKLLHYINETFNMKLTDLQVATVNRLLHIDGISNELREILNIRLQSSKTSVSKYRRALQSVSKDGRLRGTLQCYGAYRTARWSGRIFQPHNMPRPTFGKDIIENGIALLKSDCADLYFENVNELCASSLRGLIVSSKGCKLVVSDLSNIEGVTLAWLAGEQWKIKAYKDIFSGKALYDMYELTYSKTFGIRPEDVTDDQRQMGKVLELAMGYGGGVGAFLNFADVYKIDLQDVADSILNNLPSDIYNAANRYYNYCVKENRTLGVSEEIFISCDGVKRMWREANPNIVSFWQRLEDAFREVLVIEDCSAVHMSNIIVDKIKNWVRIKLPSGRYICYPGSRILNGSIKYLGMNQYSRKWGLISSYGGKLAENVTQAVARDILAQGIVASENKGYKNLLSVHDEIITETPDTDEFTETELSNILSTNPEWAYGLPLHAKGFEGYRYRKD